MFSSRQSEDWNKFHSRYGQVNDPSDRPSMMKAAMSTMGSSCRTLGAAAAAVTDGMAAAVLGEDSLEASSQHDRRSMVKGGDLDGRRPSSGVTRSSSARNLPRTSSARNLAIARGGKAARGAPVPRSSSGGLLALRGTLGSGGGTGSSMRNLMRTNSGDGATRKPIKPRSRSPMPDRRRKSPMRPTVSMDS